MGGNLYCYTFATARLVWVFIQRVQALTRRPSCCVHCKFGCKRTMLARIEWLRLIVLLYPLLQIAHILGIPLTTFIS